MRNDRMKERREALGLSQSQLGQLIGIEGSAVYRYERGAVEPSADMVAKIAKALEVTTDYLLDLTSDPHGYITVRDLTPAERRLIAAARAGLYVELMQAVLDLSEEEKQAKSTN